MNGDELLAGWLADAAREAGARAATARRSHDALADKGTKYAEAIAAIADAHEAAARLYRTRLAEHRRRVEGGA